MDKPQILTLNVQPEAIKKLKELNFNIYEGVFGKIVSLNNATSNKQFICIPYMDFPDNLHEYDIIIIDLDHVETISYDKDYHISTENKTGDDSYIVCSSPQTLFDSRGICSHMLKKELEEFIKHDSIIIAFQSAQETFSYTIIEIENGNADSYTEEHKLYDFLPDSIVYPSKKRGKETTVFEDKTDISNFLNKYNSEFYYKTIFEIPEVFEDYNPIDSTYKRKKLPDPNFLPFVYNKDEEVISFGYILDETIIYMFPQMKDYSNFLSEFLTNIAPNYSPTVFPNSTENLWLKEAIYALPNQLKLEEERKLLKENWEKQDADKEQEIEQNYKGFEFLHKILTESGDELVEAMIIYLKWLGFDNPKNMDDEKVEGQNNEEDIQIENEKGLLVIEVKGIGGTSKDNECSQISKIKYRRAKERNSFDVFGLYIVNHQRYLPPLNRQNPPFLPQQIEDAESEERGLLTTFQLFNLYFDIENGIISKEEARESLYNYGLVQFRPSNLIYVGEAEKIYQNGSIISTNINDVNIKVGQQLYIEKDNRFQIAIISGIEKDKEPLQSVSEGKIGIKVDAKAKEGAKIWIKEE